MTEPWKEIILKDNKRFKIIVGIVLILSSFFMYALHVLIFKDLHHVLVFGFEDLAFIPIEVLVVTLLIEEFMKRREKAHLLEKLNMLIGVFYTRLGLKLLGCFVKEDLNKDNISDKMLFTPHWKDSDFDRLMEETKSFKYNLQFDGKSLAALKESLNKHEDFLTGLLQNPSLLEHESFTELLSALFHLQEEMGFRQDITSLKEYEIKHLNIDLQRVYKLLTYEYVAYMKYIKKEYPYMFVTAVIHNPYDKRSSEEIEEKIMKDY